MAGECVGAVTENKAHVVGGGRGRVGSGGVLAEGKREKVGLLGRDMGTEGIQDGVKR